MTLPLIEHLFFPAGRTHRLPFWTLTFATAAIFLLAFVGLEHLLGHASTLVLYPPGIWIAFTLAARRYHDLDKRAFWLLWLLLPLLGPLLVAVELFFRRGTPGDNRFGPDRLAIVHDYHVVR